MSQPIKISPENIETANYLPMLKADFLKMFDIAIISEEITGLLEVKDTAGNMHVVAYFMNGKAYQSDKPENQVFKSGEVTTVH